MTVALALCFSLSVGVSPASAHNSLSSTSPNDGEILDTAPVSWALTFSGDVPLDSATAELVLADGSRIPLGPPTQGATSSEIVFGLPAGLEGEITGRWRLVGTDGHVITGRVQFSVLAIPEDTVVESPEPTGGTEVPTPSSQAPSDGVETPVSEESADVSGEAPSFTEPTPEWIRWVLQVLSYVGLIVVGGLVFAELALARGILRRKRAALALPLGSLGLFLSASLTSLVHVADTEGVGFDSAFGALGSIGDSTAGSMLAVRTAVSFLLLMAALALNQGTTIRSYVRVLAALMMAYIVTMPFTGHSWSMRWPILGVSAGVVHLVGIAIWAGGLFALVTFIMPAAHSGRSVTAYRRFSVFASWAVGAIVVTGVVQSVRLHEQPSSLLGSSHGVILTVKTVLVLAMVAIGWWSRKLLFERAEVSDEDSRKALIRVTSAEAALGVVVLAVSAALVRSAFG